MNISSTAFFVPVAQEMNLCSKTVGHRLVLQWIDVHLRGCLIALVCSGGIAEDVQMSGYGSPHFVLGTQG